VKLNKHAALSAVALCCLASLSSASRAQTPNIATQSTQTAITLPWVLQKTLVNNAVLQTYSYDQRIVEAQAIQAAFRPNPEMSVSVANVFGTGQVSGVKSAETTLVLSQLIELGNKRQRRIDLAEQQQKNLQSEFELRRLEVLSESTLRYYQMLRLQAISSWLTSKQKVEEKALQTIKHRATAGNVSAADVSKMSLRVTKTIANSLQLNGQFLLAKQRLAMMWAEQPNFDRVSGELALPITLPSTAQVQNAVESAPEFVQLLNDERILQAQTRSEIAKGDFDINVGVGIRRFEAFDESALVLNFSMPLTLANANQGNILAAKQRENKVFQQQKLARTHIRLTLLEVQQGLKNNAEQAKYLHQMSLPLAEQLLKDTQKAYASGQVSVLQLVDAQSELFGVKRELIEARFAVMMQLLELERITGQSMTSQNQVALAPFSSNSVLTNQLNSQPLEQF
jgi:cobalt-zinc-cadmium efflux system outer membrane protein